MKYTMLTTSVASGKLCRAGDVVELSVNDAKILKGLGRIEEFVEKEAPAKVDRSVGLAASEEKPKKRSRKAK
jgi:hypothetical protein